MRSFKFGPGCLFLALAFASAHGQTGKSTLADYLKAKPWDFAKMGPMMVVQPEKTREQNPGGGLAAFDRMAVSCGSITAIVPVDMVILDDHLKDPPNFWQGLTRNDKILYLMSTLSPGQWRLAGTAGIGMGDLQGEQKAVFAAILPTQMKWTNSKVGENGTDEEDLPQNQISQVRLHLYRSMIYGAHLQSGPGVTGAIPQIADTHSFGQQIHSRIQTPDGDKDSFYGVKIRKTLPNKLKPSNLNYERRELDPPVDLPESWTMKEVLAAASQSSGLTLVPDARIANLKVTFAGRRARTGDVLQGLALALGGTFRKVGSTYILTSDIEGIGTKRLRIAMWAEQLNREVDRRRDEWSLNIAKSTGYANLGYQAGDQFAPNDAMVNWMKENGDNDRAEGLPLSELPSNQQALITREAQRVAQSQPIRTDHIIPNPQIEWNFILPDSRPLEFEGPSFSTERFRIRTPYDWKSEEIPKPTPLSIPKNLAIPLILRADDESAAVRAVATASEAGFSELWLLTVRERVLDTALKAATDANLPVRLVIRPWEASGALSDPDRTVLEETSSRTYDIQNGPFEVMEEMKYPRVATGPTYNPADPSTGSHCASLAKLAGDARLAGIVLSDTEPLGYEPTRTRSIYYNYSPQVAAAGDLGFSTFNREAFIGQHNVDPIDIVQSFDSLDGFQSPRVNLTVPFFVGSDTNMAFGYTYVPEPDGILDIWDRFCADANRNLISQLANGLTLPTLIERRRIDKDVPPFASVTAEPWQTGRQLPVFEGNQNLSGSRNSVSIVRVGYPMSPRIAGEIWNELKEKLDKPTTMVALDLTSLPSDQWARLIASWFVPGK
jgi:hypothetical protein